MAKKKSKTAAKKELEKYFEKELLKQSKYKPPKGEISIDKPSDKQLHFTFKKTRSATNKAELFFDKSGPAIDRMIKKQKVTIKGKKTYKEPRGAFIIIETSKDKVKAEPLPFETAVTKENVQKAVNDMIKGIIEDYDPDLGETDDSDENLDPQTIKDVTIKFIY